MGFSETYIASGSGMPTSRSCGTHASWIKDASSGAVERFTDGSWRNLKKAGSLWALKRAVGTSEAGETCKSLIFTRFPSAPP